MYLEALLILLSSRFAIISAVAANQDTSVNSVASKFHREFLPRRSMQLNHLASNSHEQKSPSAVSSIYSFINKRQAHHANTTQPQKSIRPLDPPMKTRPVALGKSDNNQLTMHTSSTSEQHMINPFITSNLDPSLLTSNTLIDPLTPYAPVMRNQHFVQPMQLNRQYAIDEFYPIGFDRPPESNIKQLPTQDHNLIHLKTQSRHQLGNSIGKAKPTPIQSSTRNNANQQHQIDKPIPLTTKTQRFVHHKPQGSNSRPKYWTYYDKTLSKAIPDKRPRSMLTNEQLMSLIDELKDFNSKQASSIDSALPKLEKTLPTQDLAEKNSHKPNLETTVEDDKTDQEQQDGKTGLESSPDDSKMNTAELAKFAKFLMSKEGANMKFQLGLDRDSPDDGDEDDERDTLLESKKTTLKTRPKDEKLDANHLELAKQLDALVEKVSTGARDDLDDSFDKDKARKKRDDSFKVNDGKLSHKSSRDKSQRQKSSQISQGASGPSTIKNDNFAQALIKQELLEDREVDGDDGRKIKSNANANKQESKSHANFESPEASARFSEERSRYELDDRRNDVNRMGQELERTRNNSNKLKARMNTPLESVLRKALDGRLGVRARKTDGGKLLIKGSNGSSMEVELPKKDADTHRSTTVVQRVPGENEEDLKNSELIVSQVEPEGGVHTLNTQKIKLEKGVPLSDEYPISERVSDRLNKLSQNLDQYFNDGFLREVEEKSSLKEPSGTGDSENQQPQASNVKTSTRISNERNGKTDKDFNVDIGIDGKNDREYDDYDYADVKEGKKSAPSSRRANKKRPKKDSKRQTKRKSSKDSTRVYPGSVVKGVKRLPSSSDSEMKKSRREESSGRETTEFENHGKIAPDLDPVELESLDTPIGPDKDMMEPDLAAVDHMKKSSGNSNVSSEMTNGTTTGEKFFEEPDWH